MDSATAPPLTPSEKTIMDAYSDGDAQQIVVIGKPWVPSGDIWLNLTTPNAVPAQDVAPPPGLRAYNKVCNPLREVDPNWTWRNESKLDSNLNPVLATTGYIPQIGGGIPSPTSGVTIGYGLDLGKLGSSASTIYAQLQQWGMSSAGLQAVTPYLGLFGQPAQAALDQFGAPVISILDAQTISKNAVSTYSDRTARLFNQLSQGITFDQLTRNVQTGLYDLIYNTGNFGSPALPSGFAGALAANDFTNAGKLLQGSANRRYQADGALLRSGAPMVPPLGRDVGCTGP